MSFHLSHSNREYRTQQAVAHWTQMHLPLLIGIGPIRKEPEHRRRNNARPPHKNIHTCTRPANNQNIRMAIFSSVHRLLRGKIHGVSMWTLLYFNGIFLHFCTSMRLQCVLLEFCVYVRYTHTHTHTLTETAQFHSITIWLFSLLLRSDRLLDCSRVGREKWKRTADEASDDNAYILQPIRTKQYCIAKPFIHSGLAAHVRKIDKHTHIIRAADRCKHSYRFVYGVRHLAFPSPARLLCHKRTQLLFAPSTFVNCLRPRVCVCVHAHFPSELGKHGEKHYKTPTTTTQFRAQLESNR